MLVHRVEPTSAKQKHHLILLVSLNSTLRPQRCHRVEVSRFPSSKLKDMKFFVVFTSIWAMVAAAPSPAPSPLAPWDYPELIFRKPPGHVHTETETSTLRCGNGKMPCSQEVEETCRSYGERWTSQSDVCQHTRQKRKADSFISEIR